MRAPPALGGLLSSLGDVMTLSDHTRHSHAAFADGQRLDEETSSSQALSARDFLKLANRHYNSYLARAQRPDLESAIRHYRRALEAEPNLPEAYVRLASALWENGDISQEQALHYGELALTYNPKNAEAKLFLGHFCKKTGRTERARQWFRDAIALRPLQLPKARLALGSLLIHEAAASRQPSLMRLRGVGEGLAQFMAGLALLPLDGDVRAQMRDALIQDIEVQTLLVCGRTLQAFRMGLFSSWAYEWGSQRYPGEPIFWTLLGGYYESVHHPDAAIYCLTRAVELAPESADLNKRLGMAYAHRQDAPQAALRLEKALALDPQDGETRAQLGRVYIETQDYMRALYYLKECASRQPKNPYIHSNMAYALFKLNDYDGAVQEYRLAISHGDDPVWMSTVAQTVGTIYYQAHQDIEAAVEVFELARELDPDNLDAMLMLAELYYEQGNFQGAMALYAELLQEDPNNADYENYIGYLLWQLDRNDEAADAYRRALALAPENAVAVNNLGVIYLDEYYNGAEALTLFTRALALKPDYTLAAFNLGRAQELLGQTSEAARAYSHALSLNASVPELTDAEILERIDQLFQA